MAGSNAVATGVPASALVTAEDEIVAPESLEQSVQGPALSLLSSTPGATATLQYSFESPARASLRVFDVQGRGVRTLIDQDAAPGLFRARWDGRDEQGNALKGVFFARLTANGKAVDTRKLVIE